MCLIDTGGVLGFDNCAYPDGAWQQEYCLTGPKIGAGLQNLSTVLQAMQGTVSMAEYLKVSTQWQATVCSTCAGSCPGWTQNPPTNK